jgi:hypothetical protein
LSNGHQQRFTFGISGSWLVSMRAQDVDSDGDIDIVLSRFGSPILVLVNNGRGQFAPALETSYPSLSDAGTGNTISKSIDRVAAADESDTPQPGTLPTAFDYTLVQSLRGQGDGVDTHYTGWIAGGSSRSPPQVNAAV